MKLETAFYKSIDFLKSKGLMTPSVARFLDENLEIVSFRNPNSRGRMDCTRGLSKPKLWVDDSESFVEVTRTMVHELVHYIQMLTLGASEFERIYKTSEGANLLEHQAEAIAQEFTLVGAEKY